MRLNFLSRLQGGDTFCKAEATPTTATPTAARTLIGQTVLRDMAAAATLCLTSARLDLLNRRMAPSTKTTGVCCSAEALIVWADLPGWAALESGWPRLVRDST